MQETQVCLLDWEDPPEKEMATHCGILAWETPGPEESVGYSPRGRRAGNSWATKPPPYGEAAESGWFY